MDESKEEPVPTAESKEKGATADKKEVKIIVEKEEKGKEGKGKKKPAKEKGGTTKAGTNQISSAALAAKDKGKESTFLSPE